MSWKLNNYPPPRFRGKHAELQPCSGSEASRQSSADEFQSRVISAMRFPLICLIVMFHLYGPGIEVDHTSELYYILVCLLGANGIAQIAVPAFFLISGYLFFYKVSDWNRNIYISKLRRRVSSLLIPYILWNALPIICGIILNVVIALVKGDALLYKANEFLDSVGWFKVFWNVSDGHPYIVPLWYIRDLMVCCLLSPLIYLLIRKAGIIYILLTGVCFLTGTWFDIVGLCVRACFFFSLGAYFSIHGFNMVQSLRWNKIPVYLIAILLLLVSRFFPEILGRYAQVACNLFIIFGIWAMIQFVADMEAYCGKHIPNVITKSVFFIYAFHLFPLPAIGSPLAFAEHIVGRILPESPTLSGLIEIITIPLLTIFICVAVFVAFSRLMPKFCAIMNGNR